MYTAKVLGVYENYDEINIDTLPEKFVIKVTHWCGDTKIITSKKMFHETKQKYKEHFDTLLKKVYGGKGEPHYKYIKPILFVEEYLDFSTHEYKFHCVHGKSITCCRVNATQNHYFDRDWNLMKISKCLQRFNYGSHEKPSFFENMLNIADQLSSGFDYIRVDLYVVDNKIYFGEYTITPMGCNQNFNEREFEMFLLRLLKKETTYESEIEKFRYKK